MSEHPIDEERTETDDSATEPVEEQADEPQDETAEAAEEQQEETAEAVEEATEEDSTEPDEGDEEAVSGTRLVLKRSGEETDIVFCFSAPATIGRFDPSVGPIDIDLSSVEEGVYVSRKHAEIFEEDGAYKIKDMGSSNGTYVLRDDFEKIDEAEIADGDEIAFGNARFVFRL